MSGETLKHDKTPAQWGSCKSLTDLATENFTFEGGQHFNIDNENETSVLLSVKFARDEEFISKKFLPGPNPFLLKEVEANTTLTAPEIAALKAGH